MGNTGSASPSGGVVSLGPPKPLPEDLPPPINSNGMGWRTPHSGARTPMYLPHSGGMTPLQTTLERPSNGLQTPGRAHGQSPDNVDLDRQDPLIFSPQTRDHRMKGHKYGHFSKKVVVPKSPGEKENIRTFFDRNASRDMTAIQTPRTMMSTGTTPAYSAFNSAYSSRMVSRTGSPHFKRKKYRAPQPPFIAQRPSSPDSFASSSDGLRQMHRRKKRRAPAPPSQVPPVEPPVDYSDDELINLTTGIMDIDEVDLPPPPEHTPPPPPSVTPSLPPTPVEEEPQPPPAPFIPEPPPPPPLPVKAAAPPQSPVHRMDSVLKKDIVRAAEERAKRAPVIPEPMSKHQVFAEELKEAYVARQKRRTHGTVKLRTTGRSWVFHAKKTKRTHTMILRNLRDKIEPMEEEKNSKTDEEFDPDEETSDEADWIPEQDLQEADNLLDEDATSPTEALTARSGNFYDYFKPRDSTLEKTDKENSKTPSKDKDKDKSENGEPVVKLFKKKYKSDKHADSRRMRSLSKFRKSLQGALGSLGRKSAAPKKRQSLDNVFKDFQSNDGWEIFHTQDYDKPPDGPIKIKHIEKRPAYAYHQKKGQLIMLPEYDRVIVTEDGRLIREDAVTTIERFRKSKTPSSSESSPPSDDGDGDSTKKLSEERKEQMVAEMQFQQVRKMNKKFIEQESMRLKTRETKPETELPVTHPEPEQAKTSDEIDQLNTDLAQRVSIKKSSSRHRRYKPKGDVNHEINKAKHKALRKSDKQKLYMKELDLSNRNPLYDSDADGDDDNQETTGTAPTPRLEDSGYLSVSSPATPISPGSAATLWPPQGQEVPADSTTSVPAMEVTMSYTPTPQPSDENNNVALSQVTVDQDRRNQLVNGPIGYRPVHFNPHVGKPKATVAPAPAAPPPVTAAPPGDRKVSRDSGTGEDGAGTPPLSAAQPLYPQIMITEPDTGRQVALEEEGLVAL